MPKIFQLIEAAQKEGKTLQQYAAAHVQEKTVLGAQCRVFFYSLRKHKKGRRYNEMGR